MSTQQQSQPPIAETLNPVVADEDLVWDRERFPLADQNQYMVARSEGWKVLRNSDVGIYGVSGPAPAEQIVFTFGLPDGSHTYSGEPDRIWRQGIHASIYDLLKPDVHSNARDLDVPLAAVVSAVPDGLLDLIVALHDRHAARLEEEMVRMAALAHEALGGYLADPERRSETVGLTYTTSSTASLERLMRQLREERAALRPILEDRRRNRR